MKKNLPVNILISVISVILILGLAETIMRFAWGMKGWIKRPIYQRSHNPYLRYELVPFAESTRIRINSDGFRGIERAVKKPEDTFRIIMLGDSETFSFLLEPEDTLPVKLENLLNKEGQGRHYEVFNFGVEGYCAFQELEMLKTKGLKYQPDLIILNYVLNDPEPGEYYFNKTFLMRHFCLVRYFTYRFKKAQIRKERKKLGVGSTIDNYQYYHGAQYFNPVKEALLELAEISKKGGNKLVIVIFPDSSTTVKDFKENYPYYNIHALLKSIPQDNIVFIDLVEEFNRLNLTPQDVSINYDYNESHKNPRALQVAADCIYEKLKKEKIIR